MQVLLKSNINPQCCEYVSAQPLPACLFPPCNFCLCDFCVAMQSDQPGNYPAEKQLRLFSAGCFPSWLVVQLCECPKGKDRNDCRTAEVWRRLGYAVSSKLALPHGFKSN